MKVEIQATSTWCSKTTIVECETLDEVIKKLQTKEIDISNIIDKRYSELYDKKTGTIKTPKSFVITYEKTEEYDVELEIYDDYRE